MKRLVIVALLLTASAPGIGKQPSIRAVLAKHDPDGRIANTKIEWRGELRVGRSKYTIYYLTFVNPISRHGQQRIAIVRNGREFMGSYQCTLGASNDDATMVIRLRETVVYLNDRPRAAQTPFLITFTERGPSRNPYFCGNGSGWENSI